MGRSSKKKRNKGGGSGRRSKGRPPLKDHVSENIDDNELLSEEITALSAIFQEDCKIITGSPTQISIKLRPYSKDTGCEDVDVSALLSVRYVPGYPYKCPKLKITQEKGMSKTDAENLLSLLHEQANSNVREGRVMIFNLVEAAQEFLSEIVPVDQVHKPVVCSGAGSSGQLIQSSAEFSDNKATPVRGPFVFGFIDLFSGSGESWHWSLGVDESGLNLDTAKHGHEIEEKKVDRTVKMLSMQDTEQRQVVPSTDKLGTHKEESENNQKGLSITDDSGSSEEKSVANSTEEETNHMTEDDDSGFIDDFSESLSFVSLAKDHSPKTAERDLLTVHLLRLACASKGPLADALPEITTELCNLGIFSESVRDLACKPFSEFIETFEHVFKGHMVSSRLPAFWKPTAGPSTSFPSSRYLNDFEELRGLGHGGFGHVVLCKNKLDGRQYAVKKIRLKDKNLPLNDHILREVATLSRLQHQHVVRYYQAWFETGIAGSFGETTLGSRTAVSSTFSYKVANSLDVFVQDNKLESTYLYIQMEYCPRTLRQVFDSYHFDKELAWHLFRQIVEGLAHIHSQGIIHRDLTPSNIFFDARNDIKIGDFGLAKFLKLEPFDQDASFPIDTPGVSIDGTGQVGTYFYTAPEIEQGWPKIDEKADMYSLGVVFFELWHPFGTAMERQVVLTDLKQKGQLPPSWVAEFPEQASLLQRLLSPIPSDRPSATELLQHAFPPRMEYEMLDGILRTMHASEESGVYDKVVKSLFDEELLSMKCHQSGVDASSIQHTDIDTELRDNVIEVTKEVFRRHCARHLEIIPLHLLDDCQKFNRNTIKLLTHGGDMLELCHELRLPFVNWIVASQKSSFKRYEISCVYRRAIGRSPPNHYLQGDFDIIGGASALTEAEVIKVTMDIITCFFNSESCDIHLNHGDLLDAMWSWIGIKAEHRHKVAELLSMMGSLRPSSPERKTKWVFIRRQLLQELNLAEAAVNRLQTVGLRFCGAADLALPRLRGALPPDKRIRKALEELSDLCNYLRIWRIEKQVYIDILMPPTENYHRNLFFQIYLIKEQNPGPLGEGALLAVGGRYDYLLHQMWDREYKSSPPGATGTSLALETIILFCPSDFRPLRAESTSGVLVCSKGGGGLLEERMELVAELWEENIKAEFVPTPDPSLTEQYEYANEHDIKCLVIITDTLSHTGFLKVRHLELKKEKEVEKVDLVRFLLAALAAQFRNPGIWS